ncbi:MAG TPA: DUF3826 domain-containing protein, partial [Lacipirellulaceae bacterium]|nr:DUF3826 domain-containing protein [Lacipirellulaceae bacterium]
MGTGWRYLIGIVSVATGMLCAGQTMSAEANLSTSKQELAYTHAITARADKIVGAMGISDRGKAARVRDLIVQQYRGLREIDDARDAKIQQPKKSPAGDRDVALAWIKANKDQANLKLSALHRHFIARLSAELTPEEVDRVKDGMTYGIVPITFNRYLELLPS